MQQNNWMKIAGVVAASILAGHQVCQAGDDDAFIDVTSDVGDLNGASIGPLAETHGGGAIFADLNNDGYPDIYLVRGSGNGSESNRFFLNEPDGSNRTYTELVDIGVGDTGNGVGAIAADYDNDGYVDIYVVNHGDYDCNNGTPDNQLYRAHQSSNPAYSNVTAATDPTSSGDLQAGVGIAYDDFDDIPDEGLPMQSEPLNEGMSAGWADVNRDGHLDVYVGNHNGDGSPVSCEHDDNPRCAACCDAAADGETNQFDQYGGSCDPEDNCGCFACDCNDVLPGQRDVLYLNNGDGTFTDVTDNTDMSGQDVRPIWGFETPFGDPVPTPQGIPRQRFSSTNAVIFADLNNDAWPDLVVTNKAGPGTTDRSMIYLNQGDNASGQWLGFEPYNCENLDPADCFPNEGSDVILAPMGIDVGDFDNDGDLDIYVTERNSPVDPDAPNAPPASEIGAVESGPAPRGGNSLWVNTLIENGTFGLTNNPETYPFLVDVVAKFSWGTKWEDFNNDGWLDLYVGMWALHPSFLYIQNPTIPFNQQGRFVPESDIPDTIFVKQRGVMTADYNRDGWVDVFFTDRYEPGDQDTEPVQLWKNAMRADTNPNHYLVVKLVGDPDGTCAPYRSTKDAIGGRVYVTADVDGEGGDGEITMMREVVSGSSNSGSTSSLELEFGLGKATEADVFIEWPSGLRTAARVQLQPGDEGRFVTYVEDCGDLNETETVDDQDLTVMLDNWGTYSESNNEACTADVNCDGVVNDTDVAIWASNADGAQ